MRRAWLVLAVAVVLPGCAYYALVEPGPREMGGFYRVDPQIAWSVRAQGKMEMWTVDGPLLQQLRFYQGLQPGRTLFVGRATDEETPRYEKGMRANDIADFVLASLEHAGATDVTLDTLRPAPFGDWSGFRFEFDYLNRDGLAYRGLGLGAVDGEDRLHLVLYLGTREHYFDRHREAVERLLASIETI
ncbi:MAG: hypothetical protein GWN84_18715 [Gammaproteobacteria bacterium]|nr:hypothetical protein [Gammaproteobacteria bacterium]NIR84858.1 hypothetical protein [Gammaproteobacteria bacterium]NIR91683.1 hypothetical protein [Gammaproteobacteria bacterium]NIU05905.1 hypothetical protein [Gammaproteobacteria bacterium]NIV52952.1 hypothetical protein [Gammaproteobacteria bacterium]